MYKFAGHTGSWLYRLYRVSGYTGLMDIWGTGGIGHGDLWGNRIYRGAGQDSGICRAVGSLGQKDL